MEVGAGLHGVRAAKRTVCAYDKGVAKGVAGATWPRSVDHIQSHSPDQHTNPRGGARVTERKGAVPVYADRVDGVVKAASIIGEDHGGGAPPRWSGQHCQVHNACGRHDMIAAHRATLGGYIHSARLHQSIPAGIERDDMGVVIIGPPWGVDG